MLADLLGALCVVFVVAGVSLVYVPAAVILLGAGFGVAAYALGTREAAKPGDPS